MKQHRITVLGKVQGVFFRAAAKEKADELGVKGTVMNQPDGCVYVEASGPDDAMRKFTEWCRVGPPRAVVQSVEISDARIGRVS